MNELFDAIENFQEDKVRLLLESGHNPNVRGLGGITPLHLAVDIEIQDAIRRNDLDNDFTCPKANIVRLLLNYGADAELKDDKGATALDWANELNYREAIEVINSFKSANFQK